jgi:uncharacterized protein (TIGR02246 family)
VRTSDRQSTIGSRRKSSETRFAAKKTYVEFRRPPMTGREQFRRSIGVRDRINEVFCELWIHPNVINRSSNDGDLSATRYIAGSHHVDPPVRFKRTPMLLRFAILLLPAALLCRPCDCAAVEEPAVLQKVVADSSAKYAELFAKQDAAGLAALFTPEAEYVDADGVVFHGRAAIEAELAAGFAAGGKGTIDIQVASIRPIADGILIEEGATTFRPEGDGQVSQSRYVALHARQTDGSWLLAGVRELEPPQLSAHEQLKTLAWLLGEWREEAAGGVTRTTWKWSDDGVALLANFTMRDADGNLRNGTHRVGWDAEKKQFRSWIFDSEGGFAEGHWSPGVDGTWSVQLHGANGEGTRLAGLLTYSSDGGNGLLIEQTNRTLGGTALPPVATRVVRRPPEPQQPKPQQPKN